MLLKPDKLPSLTTSYRPISLISSIMKLFNRVIEQRLRSHLEQIGFISKHQSGFRKTKSTDGHLFRLSQSIMESFNRGEHDLPTPHHKQNSLSQSADDTTQWAFSLNRPIAAKLLQQDLLKLAMWCAK